MLVKLDKARVTGTEFRWDKARAELIVDEGEPSTATVRVLDRRTGAELASHGGEYQAVDATQWTVGGWTVARISGCGCGGTTTTPL